MARHSTLACFSFAAYAKTLIHQLNNLNIPILPGLTDHEFSSLESSFRFSFPPDLRSILQEGLPIAPHFPNWRSSSHQQLQIILNLPLLNLSRNISHNNFWFDSWGHKPDDISQALTVAKKFFGESPVLIPVYGNCYIPCSPNAAGNPVFYVDHKCVRVLSFDLSRFFQEFEFFQTGGVHLIRSVPRHNHDEANSMNVPAWAATAARRIDFWTELAEEGRKVVARVDTCGWWRRSGGEEAELGSCLEEVFWKLRDGGWKEEEVREMMLMMDGCDDDEECSGTHRGGVKVDVAWHVSVLSLVLLRAGWSREDVVYSLDLQEIDDDSVNKSLFDFQISTNKNNSCCCSKEEDHDHLQRSSIKQLVNLRSLQV